MKLLQNATVNTGATVGQRVEEIQPRTPTAHHQHILRGLWHQDGGPHHREDQGPSPQQCRIQGSCHIICDGRSGGVLVREGGCHGSGHPKPQPRRKNPGTGDQLWFQTSSTNRGQDAAQPRETLQKGEDSRNQSQRTGHQHLPSRDARDAAIDNMDYGALHDIAGLFGTKPPAKSKTRKR